MSQEILKKILQRKTEESFYHGLEALILWSRVEQSGIGESEAKRLRETFWEAVVDFELA